MQQKVIISLDLFTNFQNNTKDDFFPRFYEMNIYILKESPKCYRSGLTFISIIESQTI